MKTLKYLLIAVCATGLAACSDFFETDSTSNISDEVIYGDPGNIQELVTEIYGNNVFGGDKSYRNRLACGYQGMNTDIEFNTKTGAAQTDATRYAMKLTNGDLSTSDGKDPWGYLNKAIDQCNVILQNIDAYADLENKNVQYLKGETLTLRAFVFLEMVKIWGDVPARFAAVDPNDPATANPKKEDRNVIYEQLRKDLKEAAELMDWSENIAWAPARNNLIRPNKAFALGLLARSDLMYAGYALRPDTWMAAPGATYGVQFNVKDATKRKELYQEALNACGEVIQHYGDTKLSTDFESVFKDICEDKINFSQTEWLWVMPFADGSRGQFMNYNCPKSTDAFKALKNNTSGSTNSVQAVVPTFIYDFENGDARKWVTIAPFSWSFDGASGIASDAEKRQSIFAGSDLNEKFLYQKNVNVSGIYLGKYRVEWMERERNGNDDGVDYPVMRYADILLMYAEASLGSVGGDVPAVASFAGIDPAGQFNKVRARAGLPSKELTMENIIDERAFEFCGEYIRKYDLMRWGKLKEKLVATTSRLEQLDNHAGEFTATGDTLYFKYRRDDSFIYAGSGAAVSKGYVFDKVWGLAKGENSRPEDFDDTVWVRKNMFRSENPPSYLTNNYKLYEIEANIDKRHYFPIFSVNEGASNGNLWNDYDYQVY
ncbi:MAG: RagB/SusD family nutrient uptake outer membrane protein [Prevotellaceae bacterium]|jgi:hypothetical protein|nr:RagB/SusD family nutrient uptake outer membrane protein [Prevotellaceae bacterium]